MVRRLIISMAGAALVTGSLALAGPALAASPSHHATRQASVLHGFRPGGLFRAAPGTHPQTVIEHGRRVTINYSGNWSGYAVTGAKFSTATVNWTQPAIDCTSGDGSTDMSPWVGIDGFSSSTVEQTGSSGDCSGASASYYAWFEMFPRNVQIISKTVKPGDQFTATVTHTSGTNYRLVLNDTTQGWTNSVSKSISAKDNSAEAVEEEAAPHLTKWSGPDPFTGFTVDGQPIGSYNGVSPYTVYQMEIGTGASDLCDTTSSLSGNDNFNVTFDKASC